MEGEVVSEYLAGSGEIIIPKQALDRILRDLGPNSFAMYVVLYNILKKEQARTGETEARIPLIRLGETLGGMSKDTIWKTAKLLVKGGYIGRRLGRMGERGRNAYVYRLSSDWRRNTR